MAVGERMLLLTFDWADDVAASLSRAGPEASVQRLFRSRDGLHGRAYLEGADDLALHERLAGRLQLSPDARLATLSLLFEIDGASAGRDAPFHYVVSTDVLPAVDRELNEWYDVEHMPGLAAVPGTARAQRHVDREGSPRYHASYDLAELSAFNSAPWLAVRATDWSSRVRPAFRNTTRVMFDRVR